MDTNTEPLPGTPRFWSWLCGLTDGEGCFGISSTNGIYHPTFSIGLRADDWETLLYARDMSGLGTLRLTRPVARPNSNPTVTWSISTIDESLSLISGLRMGGGLVSKKSRDLAIWSEALALLDSHGGGIHSPARSQLTDLRTLLPEIRKYQPFDETILHEYLGRRGGRVGRSTSGFWKSDASVTHRQWRQLRYAKLSQEQIDEIVGRISSGESRSALAREFSVSTSTIDKFVSGRYLRRDGTLERSSFTIGPSAASKEFWASELGQLRRKQISDSKRKLSDEQLSAVILDREAGLTGPELARKYGVSKPTIYKILRQAGGTLYLRDSQ